MDNLTPPPTPDEEWAKKLGLDFDPETVKQEEETEAPKPPVPPTPPTPQPPFNNQSSTWQVPPPAQEAEKMPPTYMLWSVLALVLCCFPPAIVAIVYSSQVSSRFYARDYEGAKKSSERAQIWIIVSIVLGIVGAALYIPISLLSPS
ncbi:MAG: CD225/dispanin family protein [Muribaculaceae bacterium]|nr:CD225/dispanin family protein [Muribaculaceae bacterium]